MSTHTSDPDSLETVSGPREISSVDEVRQPQGTFGALMRELRDRNGLSQDDLAKLLAQSTSYVSLLETGRRKPTRRVVSNLCSALTLSEEDEAKLTAAAGFPVDQLGRAIEYVVDLVMAAAPGEDLERETVRADLTATADTWRELVAGKRLITTGSFQDAREHYERLRDRKQVSPTLKAMILASVADTSEKSGDLRHARKAIEGAMKAVRKFPSGWALPLQAEIDAIQAMLEIRQGHYAEARTLIDRSEFTYHKVERAAKQPSSLAAFGLAKSYIRQAFLFMLEGKPELALPACDRAEEQVDRVSVSERDRRRLRVWGIRAWAYSKLPEKVDPQHLAKARLLHEQALRIYEDLHDRYGVAKELLYIGDVVREAIDAHLPADVDVTDTELRRSRLLEILEPIHNHVDEAQEYYSRSIEAFGETQEGIMLSRALRSLGEIMRLQNILHPTREYYQEAHRLLDSALSNESEVGQGRRIPLTYESLAKLEWDHGALASARGYYEEAFKQLEYVGVSESDNAAEALRNRCLRALDILSKASSQARLTPAIAGALEAVKDDAESAIKWRHACAALVLRVKQAITERRWEPYAVSDLEPKWIDLMRDMEIPASGSRYILQRHLSAALSKSLTAGFPADKADVHGKRVELMQRNIAAANAAGGVGAYYDLCCRGPVERTFRNSYTRRLCESQIDAALELLGASEQRGRRNLGYNLYTSVYDVPIGFALRGDRVYLEIPVGLAQSLGVAKDNLAPGSVLCYTCDDNADLLHDLTNMFDDFVKLSQNLNNVDTTESWLSQLRKECVRTVQPAAVGAM